jgi:hypothetical protein
MLFAYLIICTSILLQFLQLFNTFLNFYVLPVLSISILYANSFISLVPIHFICSLILLFFSTYTFTLGNWNCLMLPCPHPNIGTSLSCHTARKNPKYWLRLFSTKRQPKIVKTISDHTKRYFLEPTKRFHFTIPLRENSNKGMGGSTEGLWCCEKEMSESVAV